MKDYDIIIGEKGDDKVLWTYYLVADFDGSFISDKDYKYLYGLAMSGNLFIQLKIGYYDTKKISCDDSSMEYIYEDIMSYLIAHGVVSENAAGLRRYEGIENFK